MANPHHRKQPKNKQSKSKTTKIRRRPKSKPLAPTPVDAFEDENGGGLKMPVEAAFVERTAPAPEVVEKPRGLRKAPVPKRPLACSWPPPKRKDLEQQVRDLIQIQGSSPDEDLLEDIMMTALRLVRDGSSRDELKIMAATLREFRYAFKTFKPFSGKRKISVFGSARTKPSAPSYKAAMRFCEEMVRRDFMIISGAGPGIMEAANGGAGRTASFGVNIRLPFEQSANQYIDGDKKLISFRYFFTRKLCFVKEASAIVLFPGGFGTHDEGFEALTLVQTGKAALIPIVFVDRKGGTYWSEWHDYVKEHLLGKGLISAEDMNLFKVTDDPMWAADEISNFYRRYHSTRWVKNRLVIRMTSPLPKGTVDKLNKRFNSILTDPKGRITEGLALPGEADQPELAYLPRLMLPFNRRNLGKLRQMIDVINQA